MFIVYKCHTQLEYEHVREVSETANAHSKHNTNTLNL